MAISDKGQIQIQVVWTLNSFSSYPRGYSASLHVWQVLFPTMMTRWEGWARFCVYLNRCLMPWVYRVGVTLFLCAQLMTGCTHPPGHSRAEGKQPRPWGLPRSLLLPLALDCPDLCTHHPRHCHPQPLSLPLGCLSWVCIPARLHAQFLPGLETLLLKAAQSRPAHQAW